MRNGVRAVLIGLFAACALAGFASAFALASSAEVDQGTTSTTEPPAPTEPPPTEPPTTEPAPPAPTPRGRTIPRDVTIAWIPVGGLMQDQAAEVVRRAFARQLVLVVGPREKVRLAPHVLGARPNVRKAVSRAWFSRPGVNVPLSVGVSRTRIRTYADRLGDKLDRAPVDARLALREATVRATPSAEGRRLKRLPMSRAVRVALKTTVRDPIPLSFDVLKPKVSEDDLGPAIVILRDSKKLRYFENARLERMFGVATGQSSFPTPLGGYEIVTMQRNPWWYPPPSGWAAGKSPVPPGPGNPLGTRWMGISAPYVGIHGTPDAASIGYSASHGCVRMRISDAEWLFQRVKVGTPVFIVSR